MSTAHQKPKPYLKTAVFGLLSLGSYAALFTHLDLVAEYFTRGGWWAALPLVTAFYFSLVHGVFASNVLSLLKLEPARNYRH